MADGPGTAEDSAAGQTIRGEGSEAATSRGSHPNAVSSRAVGSRSHGVQLFVVCASAAVTQFLFTRRGWFYLDDIRNLGEARRSGLSLHLLISPIGNEHFQPGGRLLHWLFVAGGAPQFGVAEAVLAASVGLIAYLTMSLADLLFGARRLHLVIAALIGTSSILIETSTWIAGSDSIPSTALMAGSSLLYCRWLVDGKLSQVVAAVGFAAAAVLFWEQAIIQPFLLGLLWLCFLRTHIARPWPRVALSLLPFVAVSVLFDLYVHSRSWYRPLERPSLVQFLEILRVMLLHDLLPPVIGWRIGASPVHRADRVAIVLSATVLLAGVFILIARHRMRWSSLVFFGFSFLALAATIAVTRVSIGPLAAGVPRYVCPLPMLAGLSAAAAASGRTRQGEPLKRNAEPGAAQLSRLRLTRRHRLIVRVGLFTATATATATATLGLLYLTTLTHSTKADSFGRVNGQHAHEISNRVRHGLRPGMTNLVDTRLGWPVFYRSTDGSDEVSTLSPFWASDIKAIGQGNNPVAVAPDGTVSRVSFAAGKPGTVEYVHLVVEAKQATAITVTIHGRKPLEPNQPYAIAVASGTTSYLLPVWAAHLESINIRHDATLTIISDDIGAITLNSAPA